MLRFRTFVLGLSGLGFERGFHLFRRQSEDGLAHFLTGLELDHGALRDRHIRLRSVGVATHGETPLGNEAPMAPTAMAPIAIEPSIPM